MSTATHPTPTELAIVTTEVPGAVRLPRRVRSRFDIVLTVTEGVIYLVVGDDEAVLTPGDEATIPAGVPYRRCNAGEGTARFTEVHSAAARFGESQIHPALGVLRRAHAA